MAVQRESVIVTVNDEGIDRIDEVARHLQEAGLKVDRVLPITGVITGSCPPSAQGPLSAVRGVSAVENEVKAHLSS